MCLQLGSERAAAAGPLEGQGADIHFQPRLMPRGSKATPGETFPAGSPKSQEAGSGAERDPHWLHERRCLPEATFRMADSEASTSKFSRLPKKACRALKMQKARTLNPGLRKGAVWSGARSSQPESPRVRFPPPPSQILAANLLQR